MKTKKVDKVITTIKAVNWSSFKEAPYRNLDMSQQPYIIENFPTFCEVGQVGSVKTDCIKSGKKVNAIFAFWLIS